MNKLILIISAIFFPFAAMAQLAMYNFNTNANDTVGGYNATSFGSPQFINGEYVSLDSTDYFELPNTLQAAIDTSKSFEIRVRFKIEGDYEATSGEDVRIIFSSKPEYDQRFGGFDISARQWEGTLQLIATYGDGLVYNGDCPSCCPTCTQSEGKIDFINSIEPGLWYNLTVKFIFDAKTPYIQYIVNNAVSNSYYDDRLDYNGFLSTIHKQQIYVGSDKNNEVLTKSWLPKLPMDIDYVTIASPILQGDTNVLRSVLDQLTNEINGNISLTTAEIDSLVSLFVINWDDQSFATNRDKVLAYMNAYANHYPAIFTDINKVQMENFTPEESVQYIMQQWILDNQYGPSTVKDMTGIAFKDHEVFPGTVSPSAPRVSSASFIIDGDYQTDPGFNLNGQENAIRPTGYYVPPGELVTITVPDTAVGKGLTLFVGVHRKNVQETWTEFNRFPRIATTYQMDTNTITVANPFGGGIYITVPDSSHFGPLTFGIDGAVKAPYYCTKPGFLRSLSEYETDLAHHYVPWVDWESPNFMCTISDGMASSVTNPDSVLSIWNKTFDAFNIALGRPLKRFRPEYIITDRQAHVKYTAAPAANPMSLEDLHGPYDLNFGLPVLVEQGRDWYRNLQGAFHFIILHEFGHLHNMPTLLYEQEANVNMPAAAVYSLVMGETIDSAFMYSIGDRLNFDQAALDWILTPIFYKGYRMGLDTINYNTYSDAIQTSYQQRGYAKLVDIANLFGWEALGNIMGYFYDYKIAHPKWDPYGLGDDQFIEAASLRMGFNMAPHFEFWGIIPSDSLVQKLDTMPVSEVIKERILHFRSLVPTDNAAIQPLCNLMISKLGPEDYVRYNGMQTNYDETTAQKIIARIDTILLKYYDYDSTFYNQSPTITGLTEPIVIGQNSSKTLAITDLIIEDPDNVFPNDFSFTIKGGANYSISGDTIIPDQCFAGILSVPVLVSDGIEESMEYIVNIEVTQISGIDYQMACEDFTWIDGITYTENNTTATYTLTNVGCDSIVTLDLTIADTCNGSSVIGISTNDILIYPNPVHDHLVIELPSADFSKVEILDITGKKILTKGVERQKIIFHSLDIENGLYFIRITGKKGQTDTFKIIKK